MMSTPAFRYAAALYRTGCPVERLCETADYLTDSPPLWEALCSPVVEVREKTAVLARLPSFTEDVRLQHFYALLAEKGRFPLLPDIVEEYQRLERKQRAKDCAVSGVPGTRGTRRWVPWPGVCARSMGISPSPSPLNLIQRYWVVSCWRLTG